jgi:hypothetical protein
MARKEKVQVYFSRDLLHRLRCTVVSDPTLSLTGLVESAVIDYLHRRQSVPPHPSPRRPVVLRRGRRIRPETVLDPPARPIADV